MNNSQSRAKNLKHWAKVSSIRRNKHRGQHFVLAKIKVLFSGKLRVREKKGRIEKGEYITNIGGGGCTRHERNPFPASHPRSSAGVTHGSRKGNRSSPRNRFRRGKSTDKGRLCLRSGRGALKRRPPGSLSPGECRKGVCRCHRHRSPSIHIYGQ